MIQTENNYDRDVFNGDLGVVEKINGIEQEMVVNFEGRSVKYDFADLDELALAYVLSIHKSQGSEFPCVVIPLHTQHYMMLQRNLLYTAVARGKKLVVLVGTKKALGMAVRREDTNRRYSALRRRLQEDNVSTPIIVYETRHVIRTVRWQVSVVSGGSLGIGDASLIRYRGEERIHFRRLPEHHNRDRQRRIQFLDFIQHNRLRSFLVKFAGPCSDQRKGNRPPRPKHFARSPGLTVPRPARAYQSR